MTLNATFVIWLERAVLIPISILAILRFVPQLGEHPVTLILLLGELVAVAMILLQRRGEHIVAAFPVLVALVGTCFALLVDPTGVAIAPAIVSNLLMFVGALISLSAKVFLGRSFGLVAANRGVKETGIYRVVRHPMYLGYVLCHIGFLLAFVSVHNILVYAVAWTALWMRINEEEKFLRRDPAYVAYASRVKHRLIPAIF